MEGYTRPPGQSSQPLSDELDERQSLVLERAVEKVVRLGEAVGVTPEEMVTMLDVGITVGELLEYLATRKSSHS